MKIVSVIRPGELGADFKLEGGIWEVNFPIIAVPPPPISNDARNVIEDTPEGMFVDENHRLAYTVVQDKDAQKIRLYQFPADDVFNIETAALVSEIDMLTMNGQFDDIAIDEGVITFTDVQSGLTLTLNTNELQKVGNLQSTNTVNVTETSGILTLTAKIDPNANNLLQVTASGLSIAKNKINESFNTVVNNATFHVQDMIVAPTEDTVSHIIGDRVLEIPKLVIVNTAGVRLGLASTPDTLIRSMEYVASAGVISCEGSLPSSEIYLDGLWDVEVDGVVVATDLDYAGVQALLNQ